MYLRLHWLLHFIIAEMPVLRLSAVSWLCTVYFAVLCTGLQLLCLRALLSPFCCIGHPAVSIGGPGYLAQEEEALSTLYTQNDILAIASAGNTGNETLSYPASYQNVISVAAVNANKVRAGFSTHNPFVDLSAPGVGVWSLLPMNSDCEICAFASYSGYISLQGTSMACPFVAGVAALLKSYDPAKANARSIHNALLESAETRGHTGRSREKWPEGRLYQLDLRQ